jgi:hypothetical protein
MKVRAYRLLQICITDGLRVKVNHSFQCINRLWHLNWYNTLEVTISKLWIVLFLPRQITVMISSTDIRQCHYLHHWYTSFTAKTRSNGTRWRCLFMTRMNDVSTASLINMGLFVAPDLPVRVLHVYHSSCIADDVERCCNIRHAASLDLHSVNTRLCPAYNETYNSTVSRRTLGVPEAHDSKTRHPTKLIVFTMSVLQVCIHNDSIC